MGLKDWSRKVDEELQEREINEKTKANDWVRMKNDIEDLHEHKRLHDERIHSLEKMWERIDEKLSSIVSTIAELVKEVRK